MQLLLLLAIFLSVLPNLPVGLLVHPVWSAAGTWGSVFALSFSAWSTGAFFTQHWNRRGVPASLRWYRFLRGALYIGTAVVQFISLGIFSWGHWVRQISGFGDNLLLDELLVMSPLLFALAGLWWGIYPAEKTLYYHLGHRSASEFWTRMGYVLFQARTHVAMLFAPLLLYVAVQELGFVIQPESLLEGDWWGIYSMVISILALLIVLLLMPWVLVRIWDTEPMPPGELRNLLVETAKRLGFCYTDFRIWHTQKNIANALVTGILPWPRYVVFSDGLLQALSPEELVAVLGHEIGHVRRWHLPLYVALCVVATTSGVQLLAWCWPGQKQYLMTMLLRLPTELPDWLPWVEFGTGAAMLWSYVWVVFGYVSRQCEREADVYGCLAASYLTGTNDYRDDISEHSGGARILTKQGIRTFIEALEKVAEVNGLPRTQWSWRHGSIARRIAYLEKLEQRVAQGLTWPRWLWLRSWAILVLLSLCVIWLYYSGLGIY
ncbi:MAG: M48 family metallopeptidase [Gemmatales bacterium]|nr:M48 family metallopeptidase [Gemmatales bacterium]MDW7993138.1 M48 family metallopeptidase [Gemmatales bacterium]